MNRRSTIRSLIAAMAAMVLVAATACGGSDSKITTAQTGGADAVTVRLGYFPNVTHATPIVGVDKGIYEKALGENKLETVTFADGTAASEALTAGAIDAAYIGPGPATNLFQKSGGEAIRIVSGAASGGASLVVSSDIKTPADLEGKTISTPKLGNTQDVAARAWLEEQGFKTTLEGGGDVKIAPQENSLTLDAFKAGDIDGAWVPEPWASRLVLEGGGHELLDEQELWPGGKFATTVLVVATTFLEDHPDVVKQLLVGQIEASTYINDNSDEAKTITNAGIKKITDKALTPEVIDAAWENLTFTDDPITSSIQKAAENAASVELLDSSDISGIYDLEALNDALEAAGEPTVTGA